MANPTDEGFFSARDGLRLFFTTTRPADPAAAPAHVVVLHGYAEHLGRQSLVSAALNRAGYVVHRMDCRGHGQSGGKRAHADHFGDYLDDLGVFLERVRSEAGDKPVFFVGHSHGGLIGARYLLDHPDAVRGAVFSSPYFKLKLQVSPLKILAGRLVSRIVPSLPMKNELNPEQLTRDVDIQQQTRADPLYQQIATPRWFTESAAAQETLLRRASEFVTPFLVLAGGADPIADPVAAKEFHDAATAKDKTFKQYDGLLHEIFHEPERDLVFRDLIGWLDERSKAAARPAARA